MIIKGDALSVDGKQGKCCAKPSLLTQHAKCNTSFRRQDGNSCMKSFSSVFNFPQYFKAVFR